MAVFLTVLSGVCWSIVYIELIRKGFKEKTCAMPLFALGLNFAWEILYSFDGFAFNTFGGIQPWVNLIWAVLDAVIVYLYFKYGRQYFPEKAKKYFVPFSVLAFATSFIIQFAFYFRFKTAAAGYAAFAQNAAMSILFVTMLFFRGNTRGQTMLMATAKWIGTVAPTIVAGLLAEFNIYVILMGVICTVFDVIYIVMLSRFKAAERLAKTRTERNHPTTVG